MGDTSPKRVEGRQPFSRSDLIVSPGHRFLVRAHPRHSTTIRMDTFVHLWGEAERDRRALLAAGTATGFVGGQVAGIPVAVVA